MAWMRDDRDDESDWFNGLQVWVERIVGVTVTTTIVTILSPRERCYKSTSDRVIKIPPYRVMQMTLKSSETCNSISCPKESALSLI